MTMNILDRAVSRREKFVVAVVLAIEAYFGAVDWDWLGDPERGLTTGILYALVIYLTANSRDA